MSLGHSNPHHRQCRRHSTLHAYAWRPSSTQTQMTIVKNSIYFSLTAELSFKNQVISLVRGCGAELQGKGLLQAKSCCSLRVYTARIRQAQSTHGSPAWPGSEQSEEHGSPGPSWEQLQLEAVHAGGTGQGAGAAACALHGSSASSPQCQEGSARAGQALAGPGAGTG